MNIEFSALIIEALFIATIISLLSPIFTRASEMWKQSWRRQVAPQLTNLGLIETFHSMLQKLQIESKTTRDKEDGTISTAFEFQGGHFFATFDTDPDSPLYNSINISYFGCLTTSLADSSIVERVVNEINLVAFPAKATISPSQDNELDKTINVNIHTCCMRLIPDDAGMKQLKTLLMTCFHIQRMIIKRYNEIRQTEPNETVRNRMPYEKALKAMALAELSTADKTWAGPWFKTPRWTINEFHKRLYGYDLSPGAMVLVNGKEIPNNKIAGFEIFSPLKLTNPTMFNPDVFSADDFATIDIINPTSNGQRTRHLLMTIHSAGDKLNIIKVDAISPGLPITPFRPIDSAETLPDVRSVLVGVYHGDATSFKAEAEYMAEEESLVKACMNGDTAYSLYWGRILYADNRLLEAEHYLLNAWNLMARKMREMTEEPPRDFIHHFEETTFFLGQLYYQLGRYKDSYFFMDFIARQNRQFWIQQYILTLQALNDPRVPQMLQNLKTNIERDPNAEEEESAEAREQLLAFIDRQQIIVDIRNGNTDKAREALEKLLEKDSDNEFALSWLKHIANNKQQ